MFGINRTPLIQYNQTLNFSYSSGWWFFFFFFFIFFCFVCPHSVTKNIYSCAEQVFWFFEPDLIIIFSHFLPFVARSLIFIIFKRFLSIVVDESYSIFRQFCAVSEKTVNEKSFIVYTSALAMGVGCWALARFVCCYCYISYDDIVMALYHSFLN